MALMLRLELARKQLGRTAIEGLRLDLPAGEIVALVGPSGSGKTTMLRIVAGLEHAFEGAMQWVDGRPARIGTVFQEPRLLPWRTVRENIALVRPPDPDAASSLLATLGLGGTEEAYPGTLSGGMARRVALVRALSFEPELLLLDEPFVSLDPAAADLCRATLLDFWRHHACTVLLVTHDHAEAAALADRIVLLAGTPAQSARVIEIPREHRRLGMEAGARLASSLLRSSVAD